MDSTQWLANARSHATDLADLVSQFHPASFKFERAGSRLLTLPITAPSTETACEVVREQVSKEYEDSVSPHESFNRALRAGDVGTAYDLLSGAWFGVPESTGCWRIRGFGVAVDLLEDPPEPGPKEEGSGDEEELEPYRSDLEEERVDGRRG
jgi:hypothetical protein